MNGGAVTSIREASRRVREGSLSAVALMEDCLVMADRHSAALNVFASRADSAKLLAQAAEIDRQRARGGRMGLLAGIPLAIKDIYATHDLPTTASSKVLAGNQTSYDAVSVAKLRDAGALLVGKTQTHEFAYGPTTVNEYAGPSHNPWNPEHVPGGSSGGSAIALATGMALGATGSDTGGSIRTPSALCGVCGLKPTYGLVSRRGILALSWSLDHAGPMARSVDDLAFLLQVMAGFDAADPGSVNVEIPDYVSGVGERPDALVVGVPREYYLDVVDSEVRKAFEQSLEVMRGLGWRVEEVSLPHLKYALGAELAILGAEASALHRKTMRHRANDVSRNVRRELDSGMVMPAVDYLLGQRVRALIIDDFATALRQVEMIATPTIPIPAPRIDQQEVIIEGRSFSALNAIWRNVFPTNLTGSPTLCLPCGFSQVGLPISLQLIGRNFDELTLFRVGHAFQSATDWHQRRPQLT